MYRTQVLILAGGKGERMGFLSASRAKPTLPFGASCRVIDFPLSNCLNSRLNDIAIITDYQRASVSACLDEGLSLSQRTGVCVKFLNPRRGSYRGTADAVFQNLSYVESRGTDLVLILAGDHIYKMDYRPFIEYHVGRHADVTVAVTPVPFEQANRFGVVRVGDQGRIVDFVEKPRLPRSNLASMGIYVFNRETLTRALIEDAGDPLSSHDFGRSLLPRLVGGNKLFAYEFNEYWRDIGTVEAYYETSLDLLQGRSPFTMNGEWPITSSQSNSAPLRVFSGGVLDNSLAAPGCVIRGRVTHSILFAGVEVAEGAMVKDSVIFPNCYVGNHTVIERCILDENVTVGAGCYIGFGPGGLLNGSSDVTLIGASAEIPPGTNIGRGCRIFPGVRRDDFTSTTVASGAAVTPSRIEPAGEPPHAIGRHARPRPNVVAGSAS